MDHWKCVALTLQYLPVLYYCCRLILLCSDPFRPATFGQWVLSPQPITAAELGTRWPGAEMISGLFPGGSSKNADAAWKKWKYSKAGRQRFHNGRCDASSGLTRSEWTSTALLVPLAQERGAKYECLWAAADNCNVALRTKENVSGMSRDLPQDTEKASFHILLL